MDAPLTLSTAPFEHPAMDYDFLRQEGIRHLERLSGRLWTDFNTHDPGITILEQVCYAITDLAHRINYPVPDLLARNGEPTYDSLYSPAQILTSEPVTVDDLRKLVIDVDGVRNAWVETAGEQEFPLYYQPAKQWLTLAGDPLADEAIQLKGLYRVLVEFADADGQPEREAAILQAVRQRLHAHRPLCEDFMTVDRLTAQKIQVQAKIEIEPVEDAERLLVAIFRCIADYIAPPVRFYTLRELLDQGKRVDEIFDGPRLWHGFIDSTELAQAQRRTVLRTSDLTSAIMDVPGVRAVRTIAVAKGGRYEDWSLPLDAGGSGAPSLQAPRFDPVGSSITLEYNRLPTPIDRERALNLYYQPFLDADTAAPAERDLLPPAGDDRQIGSYYSIQHQFPAVYGIGAVGLTDSAPPARIAQAKQLKAYLLFFDQLLANYFAQLAHARDLFSFSASGGQTYFAQVIDDPSLGLQDIYRSDAAAFGERLQALTDPGGSALDAEGVVRRNRFLNHLLARFAEQFTDYSLALYGSRAAANSTAALAGAKQRFLRHYPRVSGARGTGFDYLEPSGASGRSGLQLRIERKLNITDPQQPFVIIEHVLLRPIDGDQRQKVPLLAALPRLDDGEPIKDVYSLQVTFVFPQTTNQDYRNLVERVVRAETPAHLAVFVQWLDDASMAALTATYANWVQQESAYWTAAGDKTIANIKLRDARDRLIEMLAIGQPYPLRDVPLDSAQLRVVFNTSAKIRIQQSQRGVVYQLRFNGAPVEHTPDNSEGAGARIEVEGTGGTIELETYRIQNQVTFEIYAFKRDSGRGASLHQTVTVSVGLDVSRRAWIRDLPHLDPAAGSPTDALPRITAYNARGDVEIENTQEGVDYQLVAGDEANEVALSDVVRGNLANLVLRTTTAIQEDIDIFIRATKVFETTENRPTETQRLDIVLPLKVRANPALALAVQPAPILGYNAAPTLTLAQTQTSARYQVFAHTIRDSEYERSLPDAEALVVGVPGEDDVRVRKPARGDFWTEPPGYTPLGDLHAGNGGDLTFALPALVEDTLLIVRASKDHAVGAGATLPSAVQLEQALLVLVQPNPAQPLRAQAVIDGVRTTGTLLIMDGQPGVFYEFRTNPAADPIAQPAYFHKRDDRDAALNKGLGQLAISVDFVIARTNPQPARADLARTPPLLPLLDTDPLPVDTRLSILAIKAQTRVAVALARALHIAPLPEIRPQDSVVDDSAFTRLLVIASVPGDKYQPLLNGSPLKRPLNGNGQDLWFNTDAITGDTVFEVLVTRDPAPGSDVITAERVVRLPVRVRPKPNLPVTALTPNVALNATARIGVGSSQPGVSYQLLLAGQPSGAAQTGNGASIVLESALLNEDATFVVQATRLDASLSVTLAQQASVSIVRNP